MLSARIRQDSVDLEEVDEKQEKLIRRYLFNAVDCNDNSNESIEDSDGDRTVKKILAKIELEANKIKN